MRVETERETRRVPKKTLLRLLRLPLEDTEEEGEDDDDEHHRRRLHFREDDETRKAFLNEAPLRRRTCDERITRGICVVGGK